MLWKKLTNLTLPFLSLYEPIKFVLLASHEVTFSPGHESAELTCGGAGNLTVGEAVGGVGGVGFRVGECVEGFRVGECV